MPLVAGHPLPFKQCLRFVAGHPLHFIRGFGTRNLRFGKVFRVATITVDHEKIEEVVRERVQSAMRKVGGQKRSAPKDGEGEQDDVDMESLASLESSDSEASSVPKRQKSKTGKAKKVKKQKTQKLTGEQKKIKKENQAQIKKARALEKVVAPALTAAKRALKADHAPVALEGLVQAAKESIKSATKFIANAEKLSAKGEKCDPWEFDAKKCAKELRATTAEAEQLAKIVKNLGTDGLATLAKTAVEAAQAEATKNNEQ